MMTCAKCSRPANTKRTERDAYGRVRDVYLCDDHDPKNDKGRAFLDGHPQPDEGWRQ